MQNRKIFAVVLLAVCCLVLLVSESKTSGTAPLSPLDKANLDNAVNMFDQGRQVFRFATFDDQTFWGDALKLHQAIQGAKFGGVGPGLSPKAALAVGLKVDFDTLPASLIEQLKQGKVNLDDPAVTLALLKLNSVVGVTGFFNSEGSLKSVGIQCALCHSTVDNSLTQGIGHRLDGWANRDLNVGEIVSLAPNLQPFATLLGVDQATVRKVLQSWSLHFSPGIRVERRMVTSLTRNCVSACARHRFILADYVCEYSVFAVFRPECAHATLKGSLGRRIVSMTW